MFVNKRWMANLFALLVVSSLILTACATPTPEVIEKVVTQVVTQVVKEMVKETVIVEGTPQVVEKEVTKIVEQKVEVVVTPTPEPPPTEPPQKELEGLWYPINSEPWTLDVTIGKDGTGQLIVGSCVEGLFIYRGDGSVEPAAATGYTISEDGTVYTINLREDAVWSDGVPVTAQHFVDSVIRMLSPELAAVYGWLLYDIVGAEAFNTGETDDPTTVSVRAVDDYTFEITLKAPTPYFESILAFTVFQPVRQDIIDQYGEQHTEPGNYVSNGAYVLDSWEHDVELVLVKNPTYWNADNVQIEKITFPILGETATQLALYENDELHVSNYPSEEVPRLVADPVLGQELRQTARAGFQYIGLNTQAPPTDNALVRQALSSAIDRVAILENVVQQPWRTPLSCTIPKTILGYQEYGECGLAFDPEQAKSYLAEAGYPDGEGLPVIQILYSRSDYNQDVLEAVASMWEDILGARVELRSMEWGVFLDYCEACSKSKDKLKECGYNAYNLSWGMDYADPQNVLEVLFAPDSPFQYTGWENERYTELMALAKNELDTEQRIKYYQEADQILCGETAVQIAFSGTERAMLVKPGITFEFPAMGSPSFKHWKLP